MWVTVTCESTMMPCPADKVVMSSPLSFLLNFITFLLKFLPTVIIKGSHIGRTCVLTFIYRVNTAYSFYRGMSWTPDGGNAREFSNRSHK